MDGAIAVSAASMPRSSSLFQRVTSALVLLVLIVWIVYLGVWPVVFLTITAILISLNELTHALQQAGYRPRRLVAAVSGLLLSGAAASQGILPVDLTGVVFAAIILFALVAELPRRDREGSLVGWALTFASACYIGWLLSHYILLRKLDHLPLQHGLLAPLQIAPGAAWVYLTLAVTWVQDTAAFFVGRTWGRHRMAPYLSPKKSWEGAAGGFISSIMVAMLAVPILGLPISYGMSFLLGAAGGIAGPLGDLTESYIKRQIGVKDASQIIPGHGGLLDRVDSMLFTAPILYYLIIVLTAPVQ